MPTVPVPDILSDTGKTIPKTEEEQKKDQPADLKAPKKVRLSKFGALPTLMAGDNVAEEKPEPVKREPSKKLNLQDTKFNNLNSMFGAPTSSSGGGDGKDGNPKPRAKVAAKPKVREPRSSSAASKMETKAEPAGSADLSKYFKMLDMHLPRGAVDQKMIAEGLDPAMLDGPKDKVRPNGANINAHDHESFRRLSESERGEYNASMRQQYYDLADTLDQMTPDEVEDYWDSHGSERRNTFYAVIATRPTVLTSKELEDSSEDDDPVAIDADDDGNATDASEFDIWGA